MSQERIRISSGWGNVTAELANNAAARSLVQMLPLRIEMRDHLRQEKTGNLPTPLPEIARQREFAAGTLGLWGPDHFVIYYRSGRVPGAGIVILGNITGDVSIFDRPGSIAVCIEHVKMRPNHRGGGQCVGLGALGRPSSSAPPSFGCLVPPAAVGKHKDRPVIWRLSGDAGGFGDGAWRTTTPTNNKPRNSPWRFARDATSRRTAGSISEEGG